MTDLEFKKPSEAALSEVKKKWITKYENYFRLCPIGQSFIIDPADVSFKTLRPAASKIGKEQGKKFKCVNHENCYEVYRRE